MSQQNPSNTYPVPNTGVSSITHLVASGSGGQAPNVSTGSGSGAGASVSSSGVDSAFQVIYTTGTGPTTGIQFTVLFNSPFVNNPIITFGALDNGNPPLVQTGFVTSVSTSGFSFRCNTTPNASSQQVINFLVIG